eukprot:UN1000
MMLCLPLAFSSLPALAHLSPSVMHQSITVILLIFCGCWLQSPPAAHAGSAWHGCAVACGEASRDGIAFRPSSAFRDGTVGDHALGGPETSNIKQ